MSDFDIFLDTDNELAFTVGIEGASEASVRSQFVLEGPKGISLCFEGKASGPEITVDVPSLKGIIREGLYNTRLEVIVDDKIFTPLQMQAAVKTAIKVEAVVKTVQRNQGPVITAAVTNKRPVTQILEAPAPIATPNTPAQQATQAPRRVFEKRAAEDTARDTKPRVTATTSRQVSRPTSIDSLLDVLERE